MSSRIFIKGRTEDAEVASSLVVGTQVLSRSLHPRYTTTQALVVARCCPLCCLCCSPPLGPTLCQSVCGIWGPWSLCKGVPFSPPLLRLGAVQCGDLIGTLSKAFTQPSGVLTLSLELSSYQDLPTHSRKPHSLHVGLLHTSLTVQDLGAVFMVLTLPDPRLVMWKRPRLSLGNAVRKSYFRHHFTKHAEHMFHSLVNKKKSSTTAGKAELLTCTRASSAHAHIYCRSTKAQQENCIIMQMSDKASASVVGWSPSTQPDVIHSLLWTLAECPKSRVWTHAMLSLGCIPVISICPKKRTDIQAPNAAPRAIRSTRSSQKKPEMEL